VFFICGRRVRKTMKITGNDIDRIYNPIIPDKNTIDKKSEKKAAIHDRIDLSSKAKDYSHEKSLVRTVMNDSLKQTSAKKLLQIKEAIANDRYFVSSEDIAEAILYSRKKQD